MLSISFSSLSNTLTSTTKHNSFKYPSKFLKTPLIISTKLSKKPFNFSIKCSSNSESGETEVSTTEEEIEEDEWLKKLPDKKKPLYAHSLPCIEAWIKSLGFTQSNEDKAVWFIEKSDWHAQLSLDITEIHIRYMKSGPGKLEKDMERRFSYALSREDIENAVLGGP